VCCVGLFCVWCRVDCPGVVLLCLLFCALRRAAVCSVLCCFSRGLVLFSGLYCVFGVLYHVVLFAAGLLPFVSCTLCTCFVSVLCAALCALFNFVRCFALYVVAICFSLCVVLPCDLFRFGRLFVLCVFSFFRIVLFYV